MFQSLIELTSNSNGFEILEEKVSPISNWKSLKIRGIFQRADSKNQNGRVYPYRVLEAALQEASECLFSRQMLGEAGHPESGTPVVNLLNVSHVVTNLKFHGNDMIGEAIIFDDPGPSGTEAGRCVGALIRNNCTVGISSRGMGAVTESYDSTVVNEYKLVTFDMVHNPSTQKAFIQPVNEGTDFEKQLKQELLRAEYLDSIRTGIGSLFRK